MNANDFTRFLTSLTENGISFCDSKSKPALRESLPAIKNLFYPPHAHDHLEMICLLEGNPVININGIWGVDNPGQSRVFIPGVVHGEHFSNPAEAYRILWITLFPQSLQFHLTTYSQGNGYSQSMKRMSLSPPMCAKLWETWRKKDFAENKLLQSKFHFLLMECLCYILTNDLLQETDAAFYHEQVVEQIINYISNYYWEDISLEQLAGIVHYSPHHLNVVFKKYTKIPVHRYICEVRLKKSKTLLNTDEMLVKQVAAAAGFNDPLYFSRKFKQRFGVSPQQYQASCRH